MIDPRAPLGCAARPLFAAFVFLLSGMAAHSVVFAQSGVPGGNDSASQAAPLPSGNASAPAGILVPREVYVGDTAEFSFETSAFGDSLPAGAVRILPRDELPVSADVTISDVTLRGHDGGATVVVRFVPWAAGIVQLPPFTTLNVRIAPPAVRIASAVELTGKKSLQPLRSPLLVPGTSWILYGMAAGVLSLLVLSGIVAHWARSAFGSGSRMRAARARLRVLRRDLRELEKLARKTPDASWYASLAVSFRRYAGSFCSMDRESLSSATGTELLDRIGVAVASFPEASFSLCPETRDLLSRIDRARFGGSGAGPHGLRLADISLVRAVSAELEAIVARAETRGRDAGKREGQP